MDGVAAFVDLLREAGTALSARELKQRLLAASSPQGPASVGPGIDVDGAWKRAQRGLRRHPNISFDVTRGSYRYSDAPVPVPPLTPEEALDRLLPGRTTGRQAELAATVRAALKERDDLETRVRASYAAARDLRAAQERQVRIEAVRQLTDVVAEVEELAAAGADVVVTIERIRALVKAFGLEPIGRAGEQTTFDPARHAPIGSVPSDDSRVTVIRPGYSWRSGVEVVLIGKAQVTWAPSVHMGESSAARHGGG